MDYTSIITSNGINWNIGEVKKCLSFTNLHQEIFKTDIPITNTCNFNSTIWNFNNINIIGKDPNTYKFDFSTINDPYRYYAKIIILNSLFLNGHTPPNSVYPKFLTLRHFFKWLFDKRILHLELIDINILIEYFNELNLKERTIATKKSYIKEFFIELTKLFPNSDFTEEYIFLNYYDKNKLFQEKENNKFRLIPYESIDGKPSIFDTIISLALADLKNQSLLISDRKIACMIVILAETGMRIGEFHKLEIDKLISIEVPNTNQKQYYLEFLTYKTSSYSNGHWTITYMTPNAVLAYNTLIELTKDSRKLSNSKYLYITSKTGSKYTQTSHLWIHNLRFYYTHQCEFNFDKMPLDILASFKSTYSDISKVSGFKYSFYKENSNKVIYYITPHQYRVTVATILYVKKHFSLEWIRIHMNHISSEMTQHYIRDEAFKKRKINLVETLIKRASKDGRNLETNPSKIIDSNIKKELEDSNIQNAYNEINNFLESLRLKKKDLNIYKDINEIIDELSKKTSPII